MIVAVTVLLASAVAGSLELGDNGWQLCFWELVWQLVRAYKAYRLISEMANHLGPKNPPG